MTEENKKDIIDLSEIFKTLMAKKKTFFKVWAIVFVLSCVWIFPQPRTYKAEVMLAPETNGESMGSLGALASSFGINLGGETSDAFYPELYPDLMASTDFVVSLFDISVKTLDGTVETDLYTYLTKHQKTAFYNKPYYWLKNKLKTFFSENSAITPSSNTKVNPFMLTEKQYNVVEMLRSDLICSVDKLTNVFTIRVIAQDPLVAATLSDSVRVRLQDYITAYRTSKTRIDVEHYKHLADSANMEYRSAVNEYAAFCDANKDVILQRQQSQRDELENEMQLKYNTYQAMKTQLEAMKSKLQERTPAFSILKCATVPLKPNGPKRTLFVFFMLTLSTIVTTIVIIRKEIFKSFIC